MLAHVFLIQCISIASADNDFVHKYTYKNSHTLQDSVNELLLRPARGTSSREKMAPEVPSCVDMKHTQASPYVVLMLFKTSGRFLGMGSILDRDTVLTAAAVVRNTKEAPQDLLTLAGRLSPWWGDGSQVYPARNIYIHDYGVAIVRLTEPLTFNMHVNAIRLIKNNPKEYSKEFTQHWGILGIPRGAWNVPGDPAERTSIYQMKVETEPAKPDDKKKCAAAYPDLDFNDTIYTCTMANFTFGWGCQGSPTLAVDKRNKLQQIAVVTDAARTADEQYHMHVKLGVILHWVKAHSLVGFVDEDNE